MYKKKAAKRVAGGAKTSFDRKSYNGAKARAKVVGAARGYLQTSGFYGRFASNGSPGAELKFFDVTLDDTLIAQAATVTDSINKIVQGVTESTRVGRKCTIRSINWRWDIVYNDTATADTSAESVRIIMYLDQQANGATATAALLLASDDYQSFNNLANSGRFKVLMDRQVDCHSPAGAGQNASHIFTENIYSGAFYKKCMIPIEFSSTTGAIGEIRSNNIGVMLLSKDGNLTTFRSRIRLRFSDQ